MSKDLKKQLLLFGSFLIIIIFAEVFLFNSGLLITSHLEEKVYLVNQGDLYQFRLVGDSLISEGPDPNISYENINLRVKAITINCNNSILGSDAQVFYRGSNEPYSESKSVRYETSSNEKTITLDNNFGFLKAPFVSGLRLDLTDTPGDIVTCESFIIKTPTTFKINLVRLSIYSALLVIIFLYKPKSAFPRVTHKLLMFIFPTFLSILLGMKLIPLAKSSGIIPIVLLCILLFSFSTTISLNYLFKKQQAVEGDASGFWAKYKYEILLISILVITTLPLLSESYFYYDDWWVIGNKALLNKQFFFSFGRPIQILLFAYFDNITIQDAFIFKWVFLSAIILYTLILYRWIYLKTNNGLLAFLLAAILGSFEPVMDLLGYAATGAFTFSLLFSSVAVVCFEEAYDFLQRKVIKPGMLYVVFTFALIFTACLAYQLGPQIVFLFFTIELFFESNIKAIIKKNLAFLAVFTLSYVSYLLFVKLTNLLYTVELTTNRSQVIRSLPELLRKIPFYESVIKQTISQVVIALTGNQFVLERYHGYIVSASNSLFARVLFFIVITFILAALFQFWHKTKSWIGMALLLCYIPMSYFVFLILSESGYLTYYAFANISILMFYFIMGFSITLQYLLNLLKNSRNFPILQKLNSTTILVPILILCAFVSNKYITDFYINFNTSIYSYVKHNLEVALQSGTINRIHVIGKISPITADVYSQFVVETALKDLNEDGSNYLISFSGNKNYPTSLPEDIYLRSLEKLSENDKTTLSDYYALDLTYRQYYIRTLPSEEDQIKLQRIFNVSGLIPRDQSSETLIIDISWANHEYYNQ